MHNRSTGSIGGACTRRGFLDPRWPGDLRPIDSPAPKDATSR